MARDEREEQQETKQRFLFEGFGSEEEYRAALANLETWLSALGDWRKGARRWSDDVPDRTRN